MSLPESCRTLYSILSFDIDNLKFNDEYLMAVDLLELKCSQLEKYVHLRTLENKNYRDPDRKSVV